MTAKVIPATLGLVLIAVACRAQPTTDSLEAVFTSNRSVPLAFGFSALLPGTGQAYNRHWIKGAVALAGEATAVYLYTSWRGKGRDGRDAYQLEAHQNWSAVRYAFWLNDFAQFLDQLPDGRAVTAEQVTIDPRVLAVDLTRPDSWSDAERLLVRELFLDIRRLEEGVYHADTGAAFSHKLPFFGEQQYYELVGKYFQFAAGWSDYRSLLHDGRPTWIDANGNFIETIDPEKSAADGSKPNVSPKFFQYADHHAEANGHLRRASRISTLILVNHLLAAVDAAIFARLHNLRINTSLRMARDFDGSAVMMPVLRIGI